jgi:hypothetical protein
MNGAPRVAWPTDIRRPSTRHLASHMILDDISVVDHIQAPPQVAHLTPLTPALFVNMSLVARSRRTVARTILRTRPYSVVVDAPSAEWVAKREAIKHHSSGTFVSLQPESPN